MNILTFSSLYPNACQPNHGLFVETRLRKLIERHPVNVRVVAPIPWFPFTGTVFGRYGRYAQVAKTELRHNIAIKHPRYPLIPKLGMNSAPWLMAKGVHKTILGIIKSGYRIDLIDAHYFYPDGVAARILSTTLGIPYVVTARGTDINVFPKFPSPRRQIIQSANKSARIITVCEALKQRIIELGIDAGKICTLRNGVDLALFRPPNDRKSLRARLILTRRTLLSVGNLVRLKGHDLVLQALSRLPDTDLIIIGEGPDKLSLKKLSMDLQIEPRVSFTGSIPQSKLSEYYGAADALILASEREGWPNVLLESMACGCPAIATNVSGIPEIIREQRAGLLLRERSAEAIVEAVNTLFSNLPDRTATRDYAELFDWDATSDGQWDIFNQIAAQKV